MVDKFIVTYLNNIELSRYTDSLDKPSHVVKPQTVWSRELGLPLGWRLSIKGKLYRRHGDGRLQS